MARVATSPSLRLVLISCSTYKSIANALESFLTNTFILFITFITVRCSPFFLQLEYPLHRLKPANILTTLEVVIITLAAGFRTLHFTMSFSKISALAGAVALVSQVSAHGTVTGIVADGI
jgi:hypothetical protein